jgi:hypothetical protein
VRARTLGSHKLRLCKTPTSGSIYISIKYSREDTAASDAPSEAMPRVCARTLAL